MYNYIIDNDKRFDNTQDAAQYIIDNVPDYYWDDCVDEIHSQIEICGIEYMPSMVLKRVDPVAYNCYKYDWLDGQCSDIIHDLVRMDDGEEQDFFDATVRCEWICDDEEEEEDE